MKSIRRSRGMTLIELLVAIGIIAILISLSLPAIVQSRESARRAHCRSNLRQIGLALQLYEQTHGGFPPGVSQPPLMTTATGPKYKEFYASYAWGVRLLPYLDQKPLYDALDIDRVPLEDLLEHHLGLKSLVEMRLPIFRCPLDSADDTMETAPLFEDWRSLNQYSAASTPGNVFGGSSSYVGNCGFYDPIIPTGPAPRRENNGLFYTASFVRMVDIGDGMSQTIAVGERAWFQGSATWVGSCNVQSMNGGGSGACLGRVYWPINALPDPPGVQIPRDSVDLEISGNWSARTAFGSEHPGGAHFLFADGSVRFLNETIDSRVNLPPEQGPPNPFVNPPGPELEVGRLGVFQRLGIRNDGLPAGDY